MKVLTSLIKRFDLLMSTLAGAYGNYGYCDHCERTTVWHTNATRGTHRCTGCNRGPS